mmetsp:Transcript_11154/g.23526  ORF Transcript_11154/g.23526 Transcript_11154/m.23526 type:complete len:460 (-) Transcript_11154:18-1397(-)
MKNQPKPLPQKHKSDQRLLYLIIFFLVKGMITLAFLNLYMGSKLEIMEQSLAEMMATMGGNSFHLASQHRSTNNNDIKSALIFDTAENASVSRPVLSKNDAHQQFFNATTKHFQGGKITPNNSNGSLQGKEKLWYILTTRNITEIDANYWSSVPSWDVILNGIQSPLSTTQPPIIHGLETCELFQQYTSANPSNRRIAPAGLFNTGTNYLSVLLDYNCQNPHRVAKFHGNAKRGHGNEWEVPWGKHTPPHFRGSYSKNSKAEYTPEEVLPIVLVRNPYGWMKSMCKNPYAAKWGGMHDEKSCLRLKKENDEWNTVDVNFGPGKTHHKSLAHFWNDWYGEYFYKNFTSHDGDTTAPFPRLIIRFEDIIFFPREVTEKVCKCAGGVLGHRQDDKDVVHGKFHYVVRSAKAGMGHGPASQRNGLVDSWIRYSDDPRKNYDKETVTSVEDVLDSTMVETFGYR